ncbi:transposase [Streptomyces brevispora]|uniref:transposase n=1 Tax=Streptomyces brevispora TaxID=887462 RepID=UPI0035DB7801
MIEPLIAAWKAQHPSGSGHQERYRMREIVKALRYRTRTGCQWELLPHDLPPTGAVRYYFDVWKRDGLDRSSLGLPLLPERTEGTRAELKRLVGLGFLDETEPGLFTQPRPQTHPHPPTGNPDQSRPEPAPAPRLGEAKHPGARKSAP